MTQPLLVNTAEMTSLSDLHDEVATSLSQLAGAVPATLSTEATYGTIASGFTSALGQALPSRDGSLRAASSTGQTIADLLRAAARKYDEGDQQGAEELRSAAEALANAEGRDAASVAESPGMTAGGATGATTGTAGGGGAEVAGQLAGQVSQFAQGLAQSVQGLTQGLTQLPQQIMQGVQGIAQSAGQAEGSADTDTDTDTDTDDATTVEEKEREDEGRDEEPRRTTTPSEGAQPEGATDIGRPPEPPPAAKPAQTRPQQFPL